MKLVIEIPNEVYSHVRDVENRLLTPNEETVLRDCVVNGTPLPEGYGDLIDRSEVIKSLFDYYTGKKTIGQCIEDVQTIIEFDGGNKDEVNNWIYQML